MCCNNCTFINDYVYLSIINDVSPGDEILQNLSLLILLIKPFNHTAFSIFAKLSKNNDVLLTIIPQTSGSPPTSGNNILMRNLIGVNLVSLTHFTLH